MCLKIQHKDGGPVVLVGGRLAGVIVYLLAQRQALDLDTVENGQLHVSWGGGAALAAWLEKRLPRGSDLSTHL